MLDEKYRDLTKLDFIRFFAIAVISFTIGVLLFNRYPMNIFEYAVVFFIFIFSGSISTLYGLFLLGRYSEQEKIKRENK
jgi:hypothetical protein